MLLCDFHTPLSFFRQFKETAIVCNIYKRKPVGSWSPWVVGTGNRGSKLSGWIITRGINLCFVSTGLYWIKISAYNFSSSLWLTWNIEQNCIMVLWRCTAELCIYRGAWINWATVRLLAPSIPHSAPQLDLPLHYLRYGAFFMSTQSIFVCPDPIPLSRLLLEPLPCHSSGCVPVHV